MSLSVPQALRTSWFTVTAFIGLSLTVLIILILSLDSVRIRSITSFSNKRSRRRHPDKQEGHESSGDIPHTENLSSNFTLPEDYFQSINCSSGYGSTLINNTIKEDEEIPRDQRNTEQEKEIKKKQPDQNLQEYPE